MNILIIILSCLCIVLSGLLISTTFKYYNLKKDLNHEIDKYFELKSKYDLLNIDTMFNKNDNKNIEIISNQIKNTYEVRLKNLKRKFERKSDLKKVLENLEQKIIAAPLEYDSEISNFTDAYLKLLKEYKEE